MELRQLRYFVAVAEERSFTRAARRLHLTQQSLSAAVGVMERQLGCRLFERTSQRVELTAAGAALLARAPAVLAAVDAALAGMYDVADEVRGELRLRYGADSEEIAEPLLTAFQERHPHVTLRAWPGMDADNLGAVAAGEIDAALAWASVPSTLSSTVVSSEQVLLAMPDRHRLAPLSAVPVRDIASEPLVMFPRDGAPAVWDFLIRALRPRAAGGPEAPVIELGVSGQATMVDRVLRGDGLCPVSESLAAKLTRPGLVLRPLDPAVRVPLNLVWRGEPTLLVRRMARELEIHGSAAGGEISVSPSHVPGAMPKARSAADRVAVVGADGEPLGWTYDAAQYEAVRRTVLEAMAAFGGDDGVVLLKDVVAHVQDQLGSDELFPSGRLTNAARYVAADLVGRGVLVQVGTKSPKRLRLNR